MQWPKLIQGIIVRHVRLFGRSFGYDFPVYVDPTDGGLSVVDPVVVNVHKGLLYEVQNRQNGVGVGESSEMLIQVGDLNPIHGRLSFKTDGASQFYLFEQPTVTSPGDSLNIVNRNRREFALEPKSVATHTPVVTANGVRLSRVPNHNNMGNGVQEGAGSSAGFSEWLLREGYIYLFRLTNKEGTGGANQKQWMSFVYYEQRLKL